MTQQTVVPFRRRLPTPTDNRELHEKVTDLACARVFEKLQGFGNTLGVAHQQALRAIIQNYSEFAYNIDSGRRAYPLATALGKTQSVVAWCAAVHELGQDRTALVCQDRIESLDVLYRDLIEADIPADRVGIVHRDVSGRYALSKGDPRSYQFLRLQPRPTQRPECVGAYSVPLGLKGCAPGPWRGWSSLKQWLNTLASTARSKALSEWQSAVVCHGGNW